MLVSAQCKIFGYPTYSVVNGIGRLSTGAVHLEVKHLLLEANVALVKRELADKLVSLGSDVEGDLGHLGQAGDLEGAHAGNDTAVLGDGLSTDEHHVNLAQQAQDVSDGGLGDLGDRDALGAQLADNTVALFGAHLIADVYDSERPRGVLSSTLEQASDGAGGAVGQDTGALGDEAPTSLGDTISGGDGAGGEETAVAEEMLTDSVKATGVLLLLERGDEVLEEEIGTGGEGNGVGDGSLEAVGVGLDGVERLVYGGGRGGVEEGDEGLDGSDRLGQVGVGGEEATVGRDDATKRKPSEQTSKQAQPPL